MVKCKRLSRKKNATGMSYVLRVVERDESSVIPIEPTASHIIHEFTIDELKDLRKKLLFWYDKNKRELPWRTAAISDDTDDQRAYAVLVSELMLQQTQVTNVINYYNKWMARWPTLPELAAASLEEVNEMWTGLGYYSRGRRLHEIAYKVHYEMSGIIPRTAKDLEQLPGVGPYTAGAVASIVFSERVPVVDGNVIRVMTRLRAIGACTTTAVVSKALWKLADKCVDTERPGDFNQALMELGATICTPKTPQCAICPVASLCHAKKKAEKTVSRNELKDIEEVPGCNMCLCSDKWIAQMGVMNYPRKEKKTKVSQQETAVCVIHRKAKSKLEFFLERRPKKGLLANLWQFPNIALSLGLSDSEIMDNVIDSLKGSYKISKFQAKLLGRVSHQFSHISQVYVVLSVLLEQEEPQTSAQAQQWASQDSLNELAIPTGMKKVFKLFSAQADTKSPQAKKRKMSVSPVMASKKNKLVTDFFKSTKTIET